MRLCIFLVQQRRICLIFQVQKRRRLNALNTVVSLLREQLKISATFGTSGAAVTQPLTKSAAEGNLANPTSTDGGKVKAPLISWTVFNYLLVISRQSNYEHFTIILWSSYDHFAIILQTFYDHLTNILRSSYKHFTINLWAS